MTRDNLSVKTDAGKRSIMHSLSGRIAVPLVVVFLAGMAPTADADDLCDYYCKNDPKNNWLVCDGLKWFLIGNKCYGPKDKQMPCAGWEKQYSFLCESGHRPIYKGHFCDALWFKFCHSLMDLVKKQVNKKLNPPKNAKSCPLNMTPNASGTACIPKMDIGEPGTPGSTIRMPRGPAGGGTNSTPGRR